MHPCDVVGLGVIAVDDMLFVDSYPPANKKVRVLERRRQGGGTASCGLVAAARLGSRCRLLGRLGDNELSAFVRQHLGGLGVDLSCILHDPAAEPVYCVIVVATDTGSRAIYGDYTHAQALDPGEVEEAWLAGAKVLLVDHFGPPSILAGVRLAKELGLQVVSDIERSSPEFPQICRHVDHLVCSAEFAIPYTGTSDARAACEVLARSESHSTVVVTAGERGCFYCTREERVLRHVRAHPVRAVDTTGCGDVFHGVFCHGLAQDWPIERIIEYASAAAAIKATRTGGWFAVPRREEIEDLLASHGPGARNKDEGLRTRS